MSNRNEIIERLENLAKHAVHYVGEPPFVMSLDDGIALRDAIAMLKAQEPRVMTLDEVRALQDGAVVWIEDNDKVDVIPAIVNHIWNGLPDMASFTAARAREVKADMLWYGVKWRCWTSRPDEKRREVNGMKKLI
jgi:hypothetical protein